MKKNIAIWASGSGTNAENIIKAFQNSDINVRLVIASRPTAGVIRRAVKHNVPYKIITRSKMHDPKFMIPLLENYDINFNVLAGYLLKIPSYLINYKNNIWLNIHPSLLPAHGGKGMYGAHVHSAVLKNKDTKSGITIHRVNDFYDDGDILFQEEVLLDPDESIESLAEKIHILEHKFYPQVIQETIEKHHE